MVHYSIRFPDDLYEHVKTAAAQDTRSAHGEILWLIKAGLATRSKSRSEPDSPPT